MARRSPVRVQSTNFALAETGRQFEALRIIRAAGVITRAEIGELLQTSASQVSRLTAPLIARRIVTVEPRLPLVEGRPTELLALARDAHYVVGLDIGGLAQDAVVTNLHGEIVGSAHIAGAPAGTRSSIIEGLVDLTERAVRDSGIDPEEIRGVGVGVRAIIDPITGVISAGPETPAWSPIWVDFDLRAALESALPWKRRMVIDDTVRALAAGERQYGHAREMDDFVYLLADSGIGLALIISGAPYIGPGHLAGEVGHITLDRDGPICGCGRRGCVEMYASTSAMVARAAKLDPAITTTRELFDRADDDARLDPIVREGGEALGRAIAILLNLLSPALVVIGGEATESAIYMQQARLSAEAESLKQPFRSARIVTSERRPYSGALGAATLVLNELFGTTAPSRPRHRPPSASMNESLTKEESLT